MKRTNHKINWKNLKIDYELHWVTLIPLLVAVVFVPMIVRAYGYDPQLSQYSWFSNETRILDWFYYYKSVWLTVLLGIMLVMSIGIWLWRYRAKKKKLVAYDTSKQSFQMWKPLLLLLVYAVFCILSTVVSISPHHSLVGFWEMFESIFCLLAYVMICFYAAYVIRTERNLKITMSVFFIGILMLGLLGLTQYFGLDFLMSDAGKDMIIPDYITKPPYNFDKDKLSLTFGAGRVYMTLYNPNYVGVYTAMLLPMLFVLMVTVDDFKKLAIYIPLMLLLFVALIGSSSRMGMIAVLGSIVLLVVMLHPLIIRYWKQAVAIVLICVIGLVCFDFAKGHSLSKRFLSIFSASTTTDHLLTAIDLREDCYVIEYGGHKITVRHELEYNDEGKIRNVVPHVVDEDGVELSCKTLTGVTQTAVYEYYQIEDERFQDMMLRPAYSISQNICGIYYRIDGWDWLIHYSEKDHHYYYRNRYNKDDLILPSETFDCKLFHLFQGFHFRDYMWGKTVPLLKDYMLVGSGPDTFTLVFPQQSYIDSYYGGHIKEIVTKPHNIYLQTWVQTGFISLLAWLVFYIWYFVDSFRLYFRKPFTSFAQKLGTGIMIATASYMISGLINDSNPATAPIYWGLLGIGVAANAIVKRQRAEANIGNSQAKAAASAQAAAGVPDAKKTEPQQ